MSVSKKHRAYALNVARQFLQSLKSNPLMDKKLFDVTDRYVPEYQGSHSFYIYHRIFIKQFLQVNGFTSEKLGRLIAGGPGEKDVSVFPTRVSLRNTYGINLAWWHDGSGMDMLLGLATISLAAAAYDLCLAKHYQGGVRPL